MRVRLRELPDVEGLAEMYPEPHDHRKYGKGHDIRVRETIGLASWMADAYDVYSIADLSCGNGEIVRALIEGTKRVGTLGDFAEGWPITGPIEETIGLIDPVDLFICSETLEHLDDPDAVLREVRLKSRFLVASSPVAAWLDTNAEHLWAFDEIDYKLMLKEAGWTAEAMTIVDPLEPPYIYQIWACS